jgi:hypothetical protein
MVMTRLGGCILTASCSVGVPWNLIPLPAKQRAYFSAIGLVAAKLNKTRSENVDFQVCLNRIFFPSPVHVIKPSSAGFHNVQEQRGGGARQSSDAK